MRDTAGNLFVPTDARHRTRHIHFELDLGAQVTAVVPQPISRTQRVELTGGASGGSFKLTFLGQTTGNILASASANDVRDALRGLTNIADPVGEDVLVAKPAAGTWDVVFQGRYAGEQAALMTADGSSLSGGSAPGVRVQASSAMSQARNQIIVYFNPDDLDPATAQNPNFYQLIYTKETARNTDDVVHTPATVTYYADRDKAVLNFANDIDQLSGPGTVSIADWDRGAHSARAAGRSDRVADRGIRFRQ